MAPADTLLVVAFGDSITDGTASTLNGDDRWPDDLSRRLHAAYGNRVSVVNVGIGGDRNAHPPLFTPPPPFPPGADPANPARSSRSRLACVGRAASARRTTTA